MIDIFTKSVGDGLRTTQRKRRRGGTIMYPSTITTNYTIIEKGLATVMDKFTGLTQGKQYEIRVSFIDIDITKNRLESGEGDRFETIASWERSMYEWYRQLLKLNSPDIKNWIEVNDIIGYRNSFEDIFIDILQEEAQFLLYEGDWTLEQMKRYASLHKNSTVEIGDFRGKYGQLLASLAVDSKLKLLRSEVKTLLESYQDDSRIKEIISDDVAIQSGQVTHALRSRPGKIIAETDVGTVGKIFTITKYRDRAPGGPKKIGQKFIAVYKTEKWHNFKELVHRRLKDIGESFEVESAYIHGANAYVDLMDSEYTYYDIGTADKFLPLLIFTDNKVDHGLSGYDFPLQVISGGGPTSIDNLRGAKMLLSILKIKYGYDFKKVHISGDNVASDVIIEEIPDVFERSDRFCGVNDEMRAIAGLKANVDGQGKSANFGSGKKQMTFKRKYFNKPALIQYIILSNYYRDDSFYNLMKQASEDPEQYETLSEGLPLSLMDEEEFSRLIANKQIVKPEYDDFVDQVGIETGIEIIDNPKADIKHLWVRT